MKREFVRDSLKVFPKRLSMYLDTLSIESYLHVHANVRLPNFDTQNSTQIYGVYLANIQVWLNQILTLKIPLTQTWIFPLSEVNIVTFSILIQQLI